MTSPNPRAPAVAFIKAGQNRDGGWGYRPGAASVVEATAFCTMALLAAEEREAAGPGLAFLRACQNASGSLGLSATDRAESWMAYSALLAFHAFGAGPEEARLVDWALKFDDVSRRLTAADIQAIKAVYHYDASIPGWPWTPGTTAWVEPTALFIIALTRAGVAPALGRISSALRLIIDRRVPSGGWNFGNPFMKSRELEASPLSTALALGALAAADHPQEAPAVVAGLRFLESSLAGDASALTLAWAVIALRAYRSGGRLVPALSARLDRARRADGSVRGDLFETALAFLALERPDLIIASSRERP